MEQPLPLELPPDQRERLTLAALSALERLAARRARQPIHVETPSSLVDEALAPPPRTGRDAGDVLDSLVEFAANGWNKAHPGDLAYIPSGGLYVSTVASLLAAGLHAFTGAAFEAPALVALEESVLRWLVRCCALPETAEGILLSGGSIANQTAIACARQRHFDPARSRAYLSQSAHHSLRKALHLCGIPPECIREVPVDASTAMVPARLRELIDADRRSGRVPWLIVATAGSTDTGTVDDLEALSDIRDEAGPWLHVDAAYGGLFMLTERGRARLRGVQRADSVTVDAHKGMMLPYGVGALLVRHRGALAAAHAGMGHYLRDVPGSESLPHYFERGPELTRPFRGLLLWLPLQLHGVDAFRDALDRCLDLAQEAARRLALISGVAVFAPPALSIVAFRATAGESATGALLARLNASGTLHVSSTTIASTTWIRLAFLSQRVGREQVAEVIRVVHAMTVTSRAKTT